MKTTKKSSAVVFGLGLVAALVLLNLISLREFFRFDLTKDRKYTLSKASVQTLDDLKDVMTVSAYFTEGLPPPYAQHARYVQDLLQEYQSASKGKFAFEFLDPASAETKEDKEIKKELRRDIFGSPVREATSVEQELAQLGLQPVQIRVIQDDQQQTKRAFMGLVIRYQGKHEVIPVVQNLADLEKDMTALMRKLARTRIPKVGLIHDMQGPNMSKIIQLWRQNITVDLINLKDEGEIPADFEALLVLGSGDHFGEHGAEKLAKYIASGKSVAFLMDRMTIDPRNFHAEPLPAQSSVNQVFELLKSYGVEIGNDLVADAACASLNVQENRGGFNFSIPVKYPFVPELMNLSYENLITKGLAGVLLPFVSSLNITPKDGIKAEILGRSSKISWLEKAPYDLNPRRNWGEAKIEPSGPYALIAALRGETDKEYRLVVIGSSAFLWDDFLSPANQTLALNIADWMLADTALLEMRTRVFSEAPLDADLSDSVRLLVKYGNILGVPLLLILCGLIRWRLRESRRRNLKLN
jgi:ABC-type uncharacterized transport system involved in gliding motility auxiliary subunit